MERIHVLTMFLGFANIILHGISDTRIAVDTGCPIGHTHWTHLDSALWC